MWIDLFLFVLLVYIGLYVDVEVVEVVCRCRLNMCDRCGVGCCCSYGMDSVLDTLVVFVVNFQMVLLTHTHAYM